MEIQAIKIISPNLEQQRRFYADTLQLPLIADSPTEITVKIGTSLLTLQAGESAGRYHYAFEIPQNQFYEAMAWLEQRTAILEDGSGKREFQHVDWNAHAVYFRDAAGNILELIARHNLDTARLIPFSSASLLRISEIGLPSPRVVETVAVLKQRLGLRVWRGAGSETFSAVGSEMGLLIVVQTGRNWLPTQDTPAIENPTDITLTGIHDDYQLPNLPYHIKAAEILPV